MTFKAYLENIEARTGVSAKELVEQARARGFLDPTTKATPILQWLEQEHGLGRGHGMAIVKLIKHEREKEAGG